MLNLRGLCVFVLIFNFFYSIGAAAVYVYGECAEEKVQDLDGSYIGEHKIIVKLFSARRIYTVHPRRRHCCLSPVTSF